MDVVESIDMSEAEGNIEAGAEAELRRRLGALSEPQGDAGTVTSEAIRKRIAGLSKKLKQKKRSLQNTKPKLFMLGLKPFSHAGSGGKHAGLKRPRQRD